MKILTQVNRIKSPSEKEIEEAKNRDPCSCTDPSFMKRPIKDNSYNREGRSIIFCYTPQLCDRAE